MHRLPHELVVKEALRDRGNEVQQRVVLERTDLFLQAHQSMILDHRLPPGQVSKDPCFRWQVGPNFLDLSQTDSVPFFHRMGILKWLRLVLHPY